MRYRVIFILLLLALLCGCGEGPVPEESAPPVSAAVTAVPEPSPTPELAPEPSPSLSVEPSLAPEVVPSLEPTPLPSPEPSLDPVLHYRTTVSYDPETGIRRTTLDPQGYNLSVYFEVPVFEEEGEGYQKINAFFDELERQFFTPENESLSGEYGAWYYTTIAPTALLAKEYPFFYERWASVQTHTDKLVSVFIGYQWMMGGVGDYGGDSYTFRTDTGELVGLIDLVDETEEERIELIFAALEMRNEEDGGIEVDRLQDYALDDFQFNVDNDGAVWINFDKYEAAYGAYGGFDIKLPVTLNPKF